MDSDKVAVVTGAAKGIGFAIVKQLCSEFQGTVYLTARSEEQGLKAIDELTKCGLQPKFHLLDIDSEESINDFKNFIDSTHGGIDVLVNNAAVAFNNTSKLSFGEQAEMLIRVNYYGTLHVCEQLSKLLRTNARVVNLSSSLGHLQKINGQEPGATNLRNQLASEDLKISELSEMMDSFVSLAKQGKHKEAGWPEFAYTVSKVGVCALTRIYQRIFDDKGSGMNENIIINSCHPGYVSTEMNDFTGDLTPDEGAIAPVYLALIPAHADFPKGEFIWKNKEKIDWVNGPTPTAY